MATEIPPELVEAADNLQEDQYNLLVASDLLLSAPKGNSFIPFEVKYKWLADISLALTMIFGVIGVSMGFFSSYNPAFTAIASQISLYALTLTAGFVALFTTLKVIPIANVVTWNYVKARINHDISEMSDAFKLFSYGIELRFGTSTSYEGKEDSDMIQAQLQTIEEALSTQNLDSSSEKWDLQTQETIRLPTVSSFSFIGSFSSLLLGSDIIASMTAAPTGSELYPLGLGVVLLVVGFVSGMAYLWGTIRGHKILSLYNIRDYEKAFSSHHRQVATLITFELNDYLSDHSKVRGRGDRTAGYRKLDRKVVRRIIGKV